MAEPSGIPVPETPIPPGMHRAEDVGMGPRPLIYQGEPRLVPNNNSLTLGTAFRDTWIGALYSQPDGPTYIDANFNAAAAANASPFVEDRWWLSRARNQAEFDQMAQYASLRRDDRARAMEDPLTNMFFTAALDPTSYAMPGTTWMRGGLTVGQRFVRGAAIGGAMVGPTELLRGAVDPTVPMSETATAIVGSTILMGLVGAGMRPTRPLASGMGRYLDGVHVDAAALARDEGAPFLRSDLLAGEPSRVTFGPVTGAAARVEPGTPGMTVLAERPIAARPAHELTLGGEGLLPVDVAATTAAVEAARTNQPFRATLYRGVNVQRATNAAERAIETGALDTASGANTLGEGTYLGIDLETAKGYAGKGGNVQAVDVTLNHPYVVSGDSLPDFLKLMKRYILPTVSPEIAARQLAEETALQTEHAALHAHVRTFKLSDEIAAVEAALKDPNSISEDFLKRYQAGMDKIAMGGPVPVTIERLREMLGEHLAELKDNMARKGDYTIRIERRPYQSPLRPLEARTGIADVIPQRIADLLVAAGYDGLILRKSSQQFVRDIRAAFAKGGFEPEMQTLLDHFVNSAVTHEHTQVVVFDKGRAGIALGTAGQAIDPRIETSFFGLRKKAIPPEPVQTIGRLAPGDDWGLGRLDVGEAPPVVDYRTDAMRLRPGILQESDASLAERAAKETSDLGLMRFSGMNYEGNLGLKVLTGQYAEEAAAAAAQRVAQLSPEQRAEALARIKAHGPPEFHAGDFSYERPEPATRKEALQQLRNDRDQLERELKYANLSLERSRKSMRGDAQAIVDDLTQQVAASQAAEKVIVDEIKAEAAAVKEAQRVQREIEKAAQQPETPAQPMPDLHEPTGAAGSSTIDASAAVIEPVPVKPSLPAAAAETAISKDLSPEELKQLVDKMTPQTLEGLSPEAKAYLREQGALPAEGAERAAGAAGTPSPLVTQSGEFQPLKTGTGLERLRMTPLMRLITSPVDFVGEAIAKLTQIPFQVERNLVGKANPANVTSDQYHWTQRLAHANQDYDEAYLRHRGVNRLEATAQDLTKSTPPGKMNETEFGSAVWERLHSQQDHAVAEVNEAAAAHRKLYDEIGDAATTPDVDFFPASSVRAAKTWQTSAGPMSELYVPRNWNRPLIERDRASLEAAVANQLQLQGENPLNASKVVDGIITDRPFRAIDDEHVGKATSAYARAFNAPSLPFARWLITDPKELLSHYVRTMGVDISLAKHAGGINARGLIDGATEEWFTAIGRETGVNGRAVYATLQSELERIGADVAAQYKALDALHGGMPPLPEIAAIRDAGMAEKNTAFETARTSLNAPDKSWAHMNEDLDDLRASRDLLRGTYGQFDDTRDWIPRMLAAARKIAMMTGLTGISSQLSDVGALVLKEGMARTFGTAIAVLNGGLDLARIGVKEAQLFGTALDMKNAGRVVAMGDLASDIGGRHTMIERAINKATDASFFVNMMNQWNVFMKGWAGMAIAHSLADDVDVIARELLRRGPDAVFDPKALARLARSGIDPDMAVSIAQQLAQHGTVRDTLRLPNTETWANQDARNAYRRAAAEEIDNTVVGGDKLGRSLYLSRPIGQTIGMFQGYGQAIVQKLMIPALQAKDSRVLAGVALMVGAGIISDKLRRVAIGDNRQYSTSEVLLRGIDRSGVTGWFGQLYNAASGMFDNRYGPSFAGAPHSPASGVPVGLVPSPDGLVRALGPVASRARDLVDLTYRTATMDWGRASARDARRLLPLNNVTHLHFAFTELERMMAGAGQSEPAVQHDTSPRRTMRAPAAAAAASPQQPAAPHTVLPPGPARIATAAQMRGPQPDMASQYGTAAYDPVEHARQFMAAQQGS